jgi:hypothetical protein
MSAASEIATPNKRDQTRRRLTTSSHFRGRFGGSAGSETLGQFEHHFCPLGGSHARPAGDFVDCTAAAETQPHTRIESANFDTRGFDHVYLRSDRGDHKHGGWEGNCAIVATLEGLGAGTEQPPALETALFVRSGFLFTV